MGEGGGERWRDIAQTIGVNCGMTHCPGKIEYNCRYFLMSFRTQLQTKKFGKKCFRTPQGTMSHRPLTNTSSLKIAAAYCSVTTPQSADIHWEQILKGQCQDIFFLPWVTGEQQFSASPFRLLLGSLIFVHVRLSMFLMDLYHILCSLWNGGTGIVIYSSLVRTFTLFLMHFWWGFHCLKGSSCTCSAVFTISSLCGNIHCVPMEMPFSGVTGVAFCSHAPMLRILFLFLWVCSSRVTFHSCTVHP